MLENRRRFFKIFNYDYRDIVSSTQVHGSDMTVVSRGNRGEGALPGSNRQKCDALITTEEKLPLTAYSADCILIYFVSKQMPLAALAHAGWRGSLSNIAGKVIRYLKDYYRAEPEQLIAALSPSICRHCYRVDNKTANLFRSAGWGNVAYLEAAAGNSFKLDLAAVNEKQLTSSGIKKDNLSVSSMCTSCSKDLFYSYRRDQGITGRMIGFLALNDQTGGNLT